MATQLIDDSNYPEVVLCEFTDHNGTKHKFVAKWPVISNEDFSNSFPMACAIGCIIIKENAESYIVSTLEPWGIASEEDLTEFEISKNLLLKIRERK